MNWLYQKIFDSGFMPHGHCYFWTADVLWPTVISDFIIGASYYSIPIALYVLVKKREDLAFDWIFLMFAAFIFACGTTHFVDIWNVWNGHYRLQAVVKFGTAVISMITALFLWPLLPKILALPSAGQLGRMNKELADQVRERTQAENALRELNIELEQRVEQRTAELTQSNNDLEQFAHVASHDLQQPLRTISNMISLIERNLEGKLDQETSEFMRFTTNAAERMSNLIRSLLDYSRVKRHDESRTMVNMSEVVETVAAQLKTELQESKVTLTVSKLPDVFGERYQLTQLMQNLISNAIKYRKPEDARIWVEGTENDREWILVVRDNGIGVDPRFHTKIFDMFRRLHRHEDLPGSGMGLAICKRIAELHGGTISVTSEPGNGAEFKFTIPK